MLIWNGTTWWIWNSTVPGGVAAILANSLLMCLPWMGFNNVRRRRGKSSVMLALILFWLSFEYFHLNWGLSWPWLTLGNVFACHPKMVLWYQVTGTSGGSLWILVVNILLFQWLWQLVKHHRFQRWSLSTALAFVIVPILLSWLTNSDDKTGMPHDNIVIVQPNIDPYEKIVAGTFKTQLQKLIRLSESAIDSNTVLVVWPETAITPDGGIEEDHIREYKSLLPLWDFLRRHPHLNLLTGVESFRIFNDKHSSTAFRDGDKYAESYNAAVILDTGGLVQSYHKSKTGAGRRDTSALPAFPRTPGLRNSAAPPLAIRARATATRSSRPTRPIR